MSESSVVEKSCLDSKWIKFLRQFGPIPQNDNMYDEVIRASARRANIKPIVFETEYLQEVVENFQSTAPVSIILTGTAGDGKTFYCRQVWVNLGGSEEIWNGGAKIPKILALDLPYKKLFIIKDLSELDDTDSNFLFQIATDLLSSNPLNVYLIAANDGQLVDRWKSLGSDPIIEKVKSGIEEHLLNGKSDTVQCKLFNLSKQNASMMLERIIESIVQHPGWDGCKGCKYLVETATRARCPILENKARLQGKEGERLLRTRLAELIELSELNETHFPVRQLLILISNAILGHPDVDLHLMTCKDVEKILESGSSHLASVFRNIFGENLSKRKRETTDVFEKLGRFGIGSETSNSIDNILVYGEDDPELTPLYNELVLSDKVFGINPQQQAVKRNYLEGVQGSDSEPFLNLLRAHRQRIFFTMPERMVGELRLWDLTVFQNAGEYLSLTRILKSRKPIHQTLVKKIVKGMNRVFTGMLLFNQEEIVLATSGSHSQAKTSLILEDFISVPKKQGESVSIQLGQDLGLQKDVPVLCVTIGKSPDLQPIYLPLTLLRFEFLCRVADGVLPSSFSLECYEDMLAYKSSILKQLEKRRMIDNDGIPTVGLDIRFLELKPDGFVTTRTVDVKIQ